MTTAELVPYRDPHYWWGLGGEAGSDGGDQESDDRWAGPDGKLARRRWVAALTLRGKSQREMAAMLGVSKTTITKDQAKNRAEWRERADQEFEAHVAERLQVLDRIRAFDLSVMEDPINSLSARQAARDGLHANHDRVTRLLGLDKPQRTEIRLDLADLDSIRERGDELIDNVRHLRSAG